MALAYLLMTDHPPFEAFNILNLPTNATVEQIQRSYKELALKHHPDRGGSQEEFVKVVEAKNKALKWAERLL